MRNNVASVNLYWGLRDYGTATWEGGDDAACEHKRAVVFSDEAMAKSTIGAHSNTGHAQEPYIDTCSKCGAKRIDNQLGLEATIEEYIANMVQVFREVWRVLRNDGTVWCNMGDSYTAGHSDWSRWKGGQTFKEERRPAYKTGLKPKDLCGIPWKLAFALQAGFSQCDNCGLELRTDLWPIWNGHKVCLDCKDKGKNVILQSQPGWYLRSGMPFVKRSAMPESVTDRPASALEYMFLLTKSSKYFFDMESIRKQHNPETLKRESVEGRTKANSAKGQFGVAGFEKVYLNPAGRNFRNTDLFYESLEAPHGMIFSGEEMVGLDVNPQAFSEAHFATFAEKLISPCIKAGTSERGACPECQAPWQRVVEKKLSDYEKLGKNNGADFGRNDSQPGNKGQTRTKNGIVPSLNAAKSKTIGWQQTCKHAGEPVPCIVFDPFSGACTTEAVARRLGRKAVSLELSMEYILMGKKRCNLEQEDLFIA